MNDTDDEHLTCGYQHYTSDLSSRIVLLRLLLGELSAEATQTDLKEVV